METNNITAAPQALVVSSLYKVWLESNAGNMDSFYKFLTTPSAERDKFLNSLWVERTYAGAVMMETAQP